VGSVALDSSVIIGLLNADDEHHRAARGALQRHEDDDLVLSMSAYAEILVRALRAGSTATVDRLVERAGITLVAVDEPIARRAATLRAEHQSLRLPDAFVLATAQERGAKLLTFDKRLARLA
jgi:predicted nucleic acid-binding protein